MALKGELCTYGIPLWKCPMTPPTQLVYFALTESPSGRVNDPYDFPVLGPGQLNVAHHVLSFATHKLSITNIWKEQRGRKDKLKEEKFFLCVLPLSLALTSASSTACFTISTPTTLRAERAYNQWRDYSNDLTPNESTRDLIHCIQQNSH